MSHANQTMKISEKESDVIWKVKAVAIALTICAHCNTVLENASFAARTASYFLASLGSLGVPVFLFISGYLFSYKPLMKCIKTKIKSIIVPWLFCGTLVYLYVYLRKGELSLSIYFEWIIGINTYLWYLSISVFLIMLGQCICYISNRIRITIQCIEIICIFISFGILFLEKIGVLAFHPYLNIFRWQCYFLLGMILRQKHLIDWIPSCVSPFVLGMISLLLLALTGKSISYWNVYWGGVAILAIMGVIMLCKRIKICYSCLMDIGKKSFSIYLLHMPVAGITVNILNRFYDSIGFATILRPAVVLIITYIFIKTVEHFTKDKKIEPFVQHVLGIR